MLFQSKSPAVQSVSTLPFTPSGITEAAPILTRVPSQSSIPKGFTKLHCLKEKDGSLVVRPTNNKLHGREYDAGIDGNLSHRTQELSHSITSLYFLNNNLRTVPFYLDYNSDTTTT